MKVHEHDPPDSSISIKHNKYLIPFWTPDFKVLSENLSSPNQIKSECVSELLKKNSHILQIHHIGLYHQKEHPCPISPSIENNPNQQLKSLKIHLRLNTNQKHIINEWITTSNYVYNTAIDLINHGFPINHNDLRDALVTEKTKKNNIEYETFMKEVTSLKTNKKDLETELIQHKKGSESYIKLQHNIEIQTQSIKTKMESKKTMLKMLKSDRNPRIKDWETNTPKDVRDGAIIDLCNAYKTAFSNMKLGNIKHFNMKFKKKNDPTQSIVVPKNLIKNHNGVFQLAPTFLKELKYIHMGKRDMEKYKNIEINHNTRIMRHQNKYILIIPIPFKEHPISTTRYCGIDPGVRTFMTAFNNSESVEYHYDKQIFNNLNNKMKWIKEFRSMRIRKRIPKRKLTKIDNRKAHCLDELHWKVIQDLLKNNDVIFHGDIKSHDIVKNGENKTLNRDFNTLKFYKFKERLLFKAAEMHKRVILVNEAFTTQTCSCCGNRYKPGKSKVYDCSKCNIKMDRDQNASKNILMKGLIDY